MTSGCSASARPASGPRPFTTLNTPGGRPISCTSSAKRSAVSGVEFWGDTELHRNPDGTLTYTFVESVKATYPFYVIRLCGGLLYLGGMLIMAWNVVKTVGVGKVQAQPVPAVAAHA